MADAGSAIDDARPMARLAAAAEAAHQIVAPCLEGLIAAGAAGPDAVSDLIADYVAALPPAWALENLSFVYDPRSVPLTEEFAAEGAALAEPQRCVAARIKGSGGGRSLLLFAHPDTERPTDAALAPWTRAPFEPSAEQGRLYGWGVADDLAGVAAMLWTVRTVFAAGLRPRGDLILVAAPSKRHARGIAAFLARHGGADGAVYLHPAESGRGLDDIKAFTPGQLEFEIEAEGRPPETEEPAHTAFAHLGRNPTAAAAEAMARLSRLDAARAAARRHPLLEAAVGRSGNVMVTRLCAETPVLSRFAERCVIGGAMTVLPGEPLADAQAALAAALEDLDVRLRWISGVSGAETPAGDALFAAADQALRAVGAQPRINALHTSSDIRNPIVQAGSPTVGFGPLCGGLTMSGQADEWVDLNDLRRSVVATARIAQLWCC